LSVPEYRLLVISDIHASSTDNPEHPRRRCTLGRELLRRAAGRNDVADLIFRPK
jgi:hypothetical protein